MSKAAHDQWEKDHAVFYHGQQPRIKLDKSALFPTTKCYQYGICVCGKSPTSCPEALLVFNKFAKAMRSLFTKTKTLITVQRALLEKAYIVLRFREVTPESSAVADCSQANVPVVEAHDLYVHLGFVNFSSWQCTVMLLEKVADQNEHGFLQLAPLCAREREPDHGIQTIMQCFARNFRFQLHYSTKIFELFCGEDQLLTDEFMVGTCLEVKPFDGVGEFSIWLGTHLERQNLVKSKATKQPKTKRPSKKKPIVDRDQQPQPKRLKHASGLARPLLANLEARPVDDASHDDSDDDVVTRAFLQDGSSGSDVGNHSMDLELELEEEQGQEEEEEEAVSHEDAVSQRFDLLSESEISGQEQSEEDPIDKDDCDSITNEAIDAMLEGAQSSDSSSSDEHAASNKPSSSSSSSDSDTSSTSSSSNKKDPADRRAPISEDVISFDGHEIHYNVHGGYLRAHCGVHEDCRRQRTTRESTFAFHNRGQGRPLGLLVSWLQDAQNFPDRASHVKAKRSSWAKRKQARQDFKAVRHSQSFFDLERDQRADEDSEPTDII